MKFWKMNGAGNDFIIINNIEEKIETDKLPHIAATLCERHLSIGADGLMVVDAPVDGGDYRMLFYNSDGSTAEMCGNGARCICRYGYENGLAGDIQNVETTAGHVIGHRISERKYKIQLNNPGVIELDYPIEVDGEVYECSYIELGNPGIPHAIVPINKLKDYDENKLRELGRRIRFHKAFPKGANVNFIDILDDGTVFEKTYERGIEDFTYACGTGSGSAGVALVLNGLKQCEDIHFSVRGGELIVRVEMDGNLVQSVFLTGPTNIVCKGEITDEELIQK